MRGLIARLRERRDRRDREFMAAHIPRPTGTQGPFFFTTNLAGEFEVSLDEPPTASTAAVSVWVPADATPLVIAGIRCDGSVLRGRAFHHDGKPAAGVISKLLVQLIPRRSQDKEIA